MNALKTTQEAKAPIVAFDMTPATLRELGLQESDVPEIHAVAQRIEVGSPRIGN